MHDWRPTETYDSSRHHLLYSLLNSILTKKTKTKNKNYSIWINPCETFTKLYVLLKTGPIHDYVQYLHSTNKIVWTIFFHLMVTKQVNKSSKHTLSLILLSCQHNSRWSDDNMSVNLFPFGKHSENEMDSNYVHYVCYIKLLANWGSEIDQGC